MRNRYDVVVIGGVFREIGADPIQPRLEIAGSGLTASAISARLGARTALVASVGDEDAEVAKQVLARAGVDPSWLQMTPGASGTFVFPKELDDAHPWPMFRPAESAPKTHLAIDLPLANTYLLFGQPELDPVAEGWMNGTPADSIVLWDRQGWLSRARDWHTALDVPVLRRVYLANHNEAMAEFDVDTVDDLLASLPPKGFEAAIVKQGASGCVYQMRRDGRVKSKLVPGFPVESASTIGSGDVFAGALAAKLAQLAELEDAIVTSNAMAAAFLAEKREILAPGLVRRAKSLVNQRIRTR